MYRFPLICFLLQAFYHIITTMVLPFSPQLEHPRSHISTHCFHTRRLLHPTWQGRILHPLFHPIANHGKQIRVFKWSLILSISAISTKSVGLGFTYFKSFGLSLLNAHTVVFYTSGLLAWNPASSSPPHSQVRLLPLPSSSPLSFSFQKWRFRAFSTPSSLSLFSTAKMWQVFKTALSLLLPPFFNDSQQPVSTPLSQPATFPFFWGGV